MKIAVIGGVNSTRVLVEKLFEHGFRDVHVWGYSPENASMVSGWVDLEAFCQKYGYGYSRFVKLVDCEKALSGYTPDVIFAVGLSQIIPKRIISIPEVDCIGFHPTALPKGRGRAAIAWLVLEQVDGAASFFSIREGVDDGPLLTQQVFSVDESDDAESVELKILAAESKALDNMLPALAEMNITSVEQDHSLATWYGRRSPEDGWVDWSQPNNTLVRLIKASTIPHPGAYTYYQDHTITILSAEPVDIAHKGVVGRILKVTPDENFVVQCGSGLIKVLSWKVDAANSWVPRVGQRLGYYAEAEIHGLLKRNADLEGRVLALEETLKLIVKQ